MGTFFNGAKCDIYIGKGAGKKLMREIRNANKSIKIISPYLSPSLVKELIELDKRNIKIQLITTDNIEDYKTAENKNIRKLIIQNKRINRTAEERRKKWRKRKNILWGIILLLILSAIIAYNAVLQDKKLLYVFVPVFILYITILVLRSKIKNGRIYYYHYTQLFPFKVFLSPYASSYSNTLVHAKLYIIDDYIAYMGSINFTVNATKYNYETRIRTSDPNALKEICEEFNDLYYSSEIPYLDLDAWGKRLYREPIN